MISRKVRLTIDNSYILLGPRLSGKSTLLKEISPSQSWTVNLLLGQERRKYQKNPSLFRKEALYQIEKHKAQVIVIDEVQKVPELLDEVHALIEETSCNFWLSGSSARKLKRGAANLLGGRALMRHLFAFTYDEIKSTFDLENALQFGLLPGIHFRATSTKRSMLRTYVDTYLKEEVLAESLVRKIGGFSRFLEVAAQSVSEPLSYVRVGKDADVNPKTAQNHFDLLEDTLIGFRVPVWDQSVRKQLAQHPKFYLFDNGLTCALQSRLGDPLDASLRGRLMEQWIAHELRARLSYAESEKKIYTWRTRTGSHEVDFLIGHGTRPVVAVEVKSFSELEKKHFASLAEFAREHPDTPRFLVCTVSAPYLQDGIQVLPWHQFLERELPALA